MPLDVMIFLGLLALATFGTGLWTMAQWSYLKLQQLCSWVVDCDLFTFCLVLVVLAAVTALGIGAYEASQMPMSPKDIREAVFDCNQYGLGARISELTKDNKPKAVVCVIPGQDEAQADRTTRT
jgi:hypothetical protein